MKLKDIKLPIIKARYISIIISSVIILAGVVGFFIFGGFNLGIDFESGLSQTVQLAPSGLRIAWTGNGDAVLKASSTSLTLEITGDKEIVKKSYDFVSYPKVSDLSKALEENDGISVEVVNGNLLSSGIISGFGFPAELSNNSTTLNFEDSNKTPVSIDQVRDSLDGIDGVKVQTVGKDTAQVFSIRSSVPEEKTKDEVLAEVKTKLSDAFGENEVVILESNYIGAKFSSTLVTSSIKAVLIAMVLILFYIWVRFRLGFAISAIIALTHDILCMLSFIMLVRFEISSTTIAALLTIIGYSLNNTIVIFDRIRENINEHHKLKLVELIDKSVSDSLSRTTFSSVTTMLAVIPLCIFAQGDLKAFAISLLFGIVIGTYSSNFIAPAFLYFFSHHPALDPMKIPEKRIIKESSILDDVDGPSLKPVQRKKGKNRK